MSEIEKYRLTDEELKELLQANESDDYVVTEGDKAICDAQIRKVLTELTKPLEGVREKIAQLYFYKKYLPSSDPLAYNLRWSDIPFDGCPSSKPFYDFVDQILALLSPMIERIKTDYEIEEQMLIEDLSQQIGQAKREGKDVVIKAVKDHRLDAEGGFSNIWHIRMGKWWQALQDKEG